MAKTRSLIDQVARLWWSTMGTQFHDSQKLLLERAIRDQPNLAIGDFTYAITSPLYRDAYTDWGKVMARAKHKAMNRSLRDYRKKESAVIQDPTVRKVQWDHKTHLLKLSMSMAMCKKEEELSAYAKLEIAKRVENGDLPRDKAVTLYKRHLAALREGRTFQQRAALMEGIS